MTDIVTSPNEIVPPPPPPQWPGYLAWAIILLLSGFLVLGNARSGGSDSLDPTADTATGGTADLQLAYAAKMAIGLKSFSPSVSSASVDGQVQALVFLNQMDILAETPRQKLHTAIVAGELQGAEEVLKRLEQLAPFGEGPSPLFQQDLGRLRTIYSASPDPLDPVAREELISRHGFFGRLALSYGLPPADPLRQGIQSESRKVILFTGVAVVGGGFASLISFILFILAIVWLSSGKIRPAYQPPPGISTVYVEMFAVWMITYVSISLLVSALAGERLSLAWSWLLALSVPVTFAWGILRGIPWSELRRAIGWHGGKGWYIEIPAGIAGYLAGLPVIAMGMAIMLVLLKYSGVRPSHPIVDQPTSSPVNILLLYSIASLFAPIIEETMFRGALFTHLRRRWNWFISALVTGLLFAVIHPQGWTTIPALLGIAMVLAALREWRGSILAPMAAHALHNGILITALVLIS